MSHVAVFDLSNAAHRISAATQPLTTAKGMRIEVTFGLLRLLSSVLRSLPPTQACYLVWDGYGAKRIRQKIYPEYKAHRESNRDEDTKARIQEMVSQVKMFEDRFGQNLPLTWLESAKYEADDIIAMIAHKCDEDKNTCTIISGDKDLLQLVSEQVQVFSPNSNKTCTLKNFADYTKGYPDPWTFLLGKALQGDSSDNIKGIPGIGEKTALKLLEEHDWDSLRIFHDPSARLKSSKLGERLLEPESKSVYRLNFKLMCLSGPIHVGESLGLPVISRRTGVLNNKALKAAMVEMQFASLLASYSQFIAPFINASLGE